MRRGLRARSEPSTSLFDIDTESPLSVAQLVRRIKGQIEDHVGRVTVEGEISRLTKASSEHLYLTLKDADAVIDVVMWRSGAARLRFLPEEGGRVVVRGEVTLYERRGQVQLVASSIQPVGKGDLRQQFEELVARLRGEGLFDPENKVPLPPMPRTVGVVTSRTGAAVRDIIKVLRRRMPSVRIVLSPCLVQGEGAAPDIIRALQRLDGWGGCDVIIIGRGGGSAEDLWAFNEEAVARAVVAAKTPIVSAVGHEVDVSICDLVADARAATPSEAAEAVVPDMRESARRVRDLRLGLARALRRQVRESRTRLAALARSAVFRRPMDLVRERQQRVDEVRDRLGRSVRDNLTDAEKRMALLGIRLQGLSPLGVLTRGYAVATTGTGEVLRAAEQSEAGQYIRIRLASGMLEAEVRCVIPEESDGGA